MLRHVDAVVVPPDMDILRLVLRFLAWEAHMRALNSARRMDEALQAYKTSMAIAGTDLRMYERLRWAFGSGTYAFPYLPWPSDYIRRADEVMDK
jgi:hypothetical protein